MNGHRPSPRGTWPGPDEELVLRAAIAEDDRAIAHWDSWLLRNDIDRLSFGSYRLLPLVYRNLSRLGYDSPVMPKLKGAYRQSWVRNRLLLEATAGVVGGLAAVGVSTVLIKGLPLALRTYRDVGARSMGDADVLVRPDHASEAFSWLSASGWTPARGARFDPVRRSSVGLASRDGLEIDLHWYPIADRPFAAAADPFWEGADKLRVGGSDILAVNPTDQVLLALVQGLTWEKDLPIRWIPDVVLSLRRHREELDWARLFDIAGRIGVSTHVGLGLAYLDATFDDVPIPGEVMPAQRRQARPLSERAELWFRLRKGPQYPWGGLPATWFQYRHRMRAAGRRPSLVGFARNKKQMWQDLEGLTVPRALMGRARRWTRGVTRSLRAFRHNNGHPPQ